MTQLFLESSSDDSIKKFAQQYNLQNTLQHLSGGISVGDLPVQLPRVIINNMICVLICVQRA